MTPVEYGAYNRKCMEFCQTADTCRNSHSQAGTLLSETAGQIEQYYIGTGNEIYTGILRQSMPTFIASVFILLAGFLSRVTGCLFTTAAI